MNSRRPIISQVIAGLRKRLASVSYGDSRIWIVFGDVTIVLYPGPCTCTGTLTEEELLVHKNIGNALEREYRYRVPVFTEKSYLIPYESINVSCTKILKKDLMSQKGYVFLSVEKEQRTYQRGGNRALRSEDHKASKSKCFCNNEQNDRPIRNHEEQAYGSGRRHDALDESSSRQRTRPL
jgi:hypothetical protein